MMVAALASGVPFLHVFPPRRMPGGVIEQSVQIWQNAGSWAGEADRIEVESEVRIDREPWRGWPMHAPVRDFRVAKAIAQRHPIGL